MMEVAAMADDDDNPLILKALEKIDALNNELARLKRFVNQADELGGATPRFADVSNAAATIGQAANAVRPPSKKWKPGEFLGKPFSAAVRAVLLARHDSVGGQSPASVDEIHSDLTAGSFNFDTTGVEAQKNSIRISLGKNSAAFARLPNSDLFGLVEWYGGKTRKPVRKVAIGGKIDSADAPASDDEPGALAAAAEAESEQKNGGQEPMTR
jgi:hypothetical protein